MLLWGMCLPACGPVGEAGLPDRLSAQSQDADDKRVPCSCAGSARPLCIAYCAQAPPCCQALGRQLTRPLCIAYCAQAPPCRQALGSQLPRPLCSAYCAQAPPCCQALSRQLTRPLRFWFKLRSPTLGCRGTRGSPAFASAPILEACC